MRRRALIPRARSSSWSGSLPKGRAEMIKAMGNTKWGDIEFKRGADTDRSLWKWRKLVIDGKLDEARKDCTVTMLDYEGQPVVTYSITNAWPKRYSGGELKSTPTRWRLKALRSATRGSRSSRSPRRAGCCAGCLVWTSCQPARRPHDEVCAGAQAGSSRSNRVSSVRFVSRSSALSSTPTSWLSAAPIAWRSRVPSRSVTSWRAAGSSMRTVV